MSKTKGGLRGILAAKREENDRLRRGFVTDKLAILGIAPASEAGQLALREYTPFETPGGKSDFSTLRLRTWLHDQLQEVV